MLIVTSDKIPIERVLCKLVPIVWGICIFVFVAFSVVIGVNLSKGPFLSEGGKKTDKLQIPSLELIGKGPLSLTAFGNKIIFPDLSREVVLVAKNLRPGTKKTDFILFLQSSEEEYKAKNGEQIFLSSDAVAGSPVPVYYFSNKKTPLWIRPIFTEGHKPFLEVGLFTPCKESESFQEERIQFALFEKERWNQEKMTPSFVEILQKAKLWGQDVVLARLDEKNKTLMKDKVKLEIPGEKTVFCFVGKGDFLQWNGQCWLPTCSLKNCEQTPIAQVKSVSARSLELEVWNEEGFYSIPLKIDLQTVAKPMGQSNMQPHSIRLRSANQVSCFFGKKHFILREGDWVLKTSKGFRNLRRSFDRASYLSHKVQGELFVFDALVKDQGKIIMKGFIVDEMRTQMQSFVGSIVSDHKMQSLSRQEKRHLFFDDKPKNVVTYFSASDVIEPQGAENE